MQIIKSVLKLLFFVCPLFTAGQTTFLQQGDKAYQFIDRMEIKGKDNTGLNFSGIKPFSRKAVVEEMNLFDSARMDYQGNVPERFKPWAGIRFTPIDEYNYNSFRMNNTEWATGDRSSFNSRKPIFNTFYTTKPNMLEVNKKDFFLAVNPVLNLTVGRESGNDRDIFLNTRGITVRGLIARKIGFSTTLTENQERGPRYFMDLVTAKRAVPGVGFYKGFKGSAVDYFDARGYVTFNATKYIDIQFGHDKNFWGNGYRSLVLSEWGNSSLFLKLNTRIWKLNYQNIFMELMPTFIKTGDNVLSRKYQTMHHLSFNISKSINVGVFEAVTFGRKDHFDFQYLNPIIFLRFVEGSVGSPDKARVGLDFKYNVARKFQFYGQFLLEEFVLNKLRNDPNNYVNKYGYQLGAKYIDAFNVPNLDIQVECNRVRPFVYSHRDSVSNYTHYNQLMAHPLGANFQEFIGIVRYQPMPRLYINARMIYYFQGLDSAGFNFGADPFRLYNLGKPLVDPSNPASSQRESGYSVGSGDRVNCFNAVLQASYEIRENIYFDLTFQQRNYSRASVAGNTSNTLITAGIRMNITRREYDF